MIIMNIFNFLKIANAIATRLKIIPKITLQKASQKKKKIK